MTTRIVLHVAMSAATAFDGDALVDAPDDWDQMTDQQRDSWARSHLRRHIENSVAASWWDERDA